MAEIKGLQASFDLLIEHQVANGQLLKHLLSLQKIMLKQQREVHEEIRAFRKWLEEEEPEGEGSTS